MPTKPTADIWLFLHRWIGLVTALFMLVAAITGSVLAFRVTLDHWANHDLLVYDGKAEDRLPVLDLVTGYENANPDLQVVGFPLNPGPRDTLALKIAPLPGGAPIHETEVFLAPDTGAVIGARSVEPGWSRRQLVPLLAEIHFNLLAGNAGRIFLGGVAIAWLFSSCVGFYLTLPKRGPFFAKWWPAWTYSPKRSFARQMLDLHRASALWLFPVVIAIAATSVTLNFYSEFWSPLATTIAPLEKSLFDEAAPFPAGTTPDLAFADALGFAQAEAARAGVEWQPATMLYLPDWNLYGVTLSDNGLLNYKYMGPIYYYFDAATGAYAHEVNPYTDSFGLKMIRTIYPLHSGEIGGPFTVFLVFVLGLATTEMCVTGIWVWWKKRGPRIAARKKAELASET